LFGSRVQHVDLPRRRWEHQDIPLPVRGTRQERRAGSLLGDRIGVGADPSLSLWPLPLNSTTAPELTEHVVEDVAIVPAAYWLAAAAEAARGDVLEDVTFDVPCRLDDPDLQLAVRTDGSFVVTSGAGTPVVHASGVIRSAAEEPLCFRVDAATPVR
jgi:acyl transferase domain-containing protein